MRISIKTLFSLLIIVAISASLFAVDMQISRTVEKISSFSLTQNLDAVTAISDNNIGYFEVSNNTRDGFSVTVSSANLGKLSPSSSADGETDIPYELEVSKDSGTLGGGMVLTTDITDLTAEATILAKSGALQTSATDTLACSLHIDFSSHADQFEMAGSYSDTLTITYTDL